MHLNRSKVSESGALVTQNTAMPYMLHLATQHLMTGWSLQLTISQDIPKARQQHSAAVGSAVVVHFAYGPQWELYNRCELILVHD